MPSPRPPSGLSIRQERFCHAYLRTGVAASAAVEAGYAVLSCVNQGYRLLQRADVQARIAAIQAELARVACDGTDVLLGKLETVYRQAVADRHYTAATRAVDLQARILRQDRLDRLRLAEIEKAVSDGSDGGGEADGRIAESLRTDPAQGSPTSPSRVAGPSLSPPEGRRGYRGQTFSPSPPLRGGEGRGEVGRPAGTDDLGSPPDGEGATRGSDELGSPRDRVEAAMPSDDPGTPSGGEPETGRSDGFSPPSHAEDADRIGEDAAPDGGRARPPRRPPEGGRTGAVVRHTRIGIRASSAREFRGADGPRHGPVPD